MKISSKLSLAAAAVVMMGLGACKQESPKTVTPVQLMAGEMLPLRVPGATEWPMWGMTPNRNMVSPGKNAPTEWDVDPGEFRVEKMKNVRWLGQLGSQSYGNPVVSGGLVIVGTNNEAKRAKTYKLPDGKLINLTNPDGTAIDGSVLKIFRESDGEFLWQWFSPKLTAGRVNDWPYQGICSTSYVDGDTLYVVTSRCEVVALDLAPLKAGKGEPKLLWLHSMMDELGVFPHNMTSSSIVSYGDLLYVISGNGVDETHKNIPAPTAPSVVAYNKKTGKVAWTAGPDSARVLHGNWGSPAIALTDKQPLVIAPLGDAWVYAFNAISGELVWKFDTNRKDTIYPTTRNELIATPVIVGNKMYIANGQDPEHGEGPGALWCVDITKTGDVSAELQNPAWKAPVQGEEMIQDDKPGISRGIPNPNSAVVWSWEKQDKDGNGRISLRERMNRTCSTVVVYNGLVFAPDFSGYLHCLDAEKGTHHWAYDMEAAMWSSPLAVDGKIYLADEQGDVKIFEASKDAPKVLATINLGSASYCSPLFINNTLYVMSRDKLFAIETGKTPKKIQ